jgi:class 3 adenylate cyclase
MTQEQMRQHLLHEEQLRIAGERAQAEYMAGAEAQYAEAVSPGAGDDTAMSEAAAAGHGVPPLPTRGSAGHGSVSRMRTINDSAIRRAHERKERQRGRGCSNWKASCAAAAAGYLRRIPGCGNQLEADTVIAGLLFLLHTAICAAFAAKYVLGAPDLAAMKAALSDGLQDPRVGGTGTPEQASLIEFQAACAQSSFVPLVLLFSLPVLPLGPGAMFTLCLLGAFFVIGARAANGLIDECLPAEFATTTVALLLPMVFAVFDARGQEAQKRRALLQRLASRRAKTQADSVLEQLLPTHVNEKLRRNEPVPFEIHPNHVVMIWADLVGFTALSATLEPEQVMTILNALYSRFDALVERANLWKVDTIGDAYVIIGGLVDIKSGGKAKAADLPGPELVERMFKVATSMRQQVRAVSTATGQDIGIRIGIHSGPVATGIIGTLRPRWHVFGPTVLEAEHMESEGRRSWIQVSEAAFRLYNMRGFSLVERVRHPEAVVEADSEYLLEIGQPVPQRPAPRVSLAPVDPKKLAGPLPAWLDGQEAAEAALEAREAEAAAANGGRQWAKPSRNDGDGALWAFWLHPNDVSGQGHMQDSFVQQSASMRMQAGAQFGRRRNSLQMRPGMFADLLALPPYLAETAPPLDPAKTVLPGTQPMLSQSPPSKPQASEAAVDGAESSGQHSAAADAVTAAGAAGQAHHTQLRPPPIQVGALLSGSPPQAAQDASVDVFSLAAEASSSGGEPSPAEPAARVVEGGAAPPAKSSGLVLTAEQLAAAAAGRPVELSTDQTVRAAAVASRRPSWRGFEQLRTRDDDDRDDRELTRDEDRRWAKEHSGADTGRSRKELKPRMSRARMFLSQGPLANVAPGHVLEAALGNGDSKTAPGATV